MRWAAENPRESGVPKAVSKDFNDADPGGKLPARADEDGERAKRRYKRMKDD